MSSKASKEEKRKHRQQIKHLKSIGIKGCFRDKKLFTGELSPGCQACGKGTCVSIPVNLSCTRNCFFCPHPIQERRKKINKIIARDKTVENNKDLINILKGLEADSCDISGGEPLLVLEKVSRFIRCVRETFGPSFEIHLNTNGDLATSKNLRRLKDAGLDEIRFNLAANGYDLSPVKKAVKIFSNVAVEIPVIPKHEKRLYGLLLKLDKIKVKYINLHELMANPNNIERIKSLGYTVKNEKIKSLGCTIKNERIKSIYYDSKDLPVQGSGEAAFRLLEFIAKKRLSIAANYCSETYKREVQIPRYMKKISKISSCLNP